VCSYVAYNLIVVVCKIEWSLPVVVRIVLVLQESRSFISS